MSKVKYHLDFNAHQGSTESYDLVEIKRLRDEDEGGGTITALDITHYIENDPENRQFDSWEEADAALPALKDVYFVNSFEVLIDPQPEGLND